MTCSPGMGDTLSMRQPATLEEAWRLLTALEGQLHELRAENAALRERLRDLEVRLGQHSGNSSRPPSADPPQAPRRPARAPTGRRRGAQPGHEAHQRPLVPPEQVDQSIEHWPATCPTCAAVLPRDPSVVVGEAQRHQVTELPPVRATITEHRLYRVRCPHCRQETRATLPTDVPAGACGPRLQATVGTLSGRYRLSRREVAEMCRDVLGAPLAVGSVDKLCQATSAALAAPMEELHSTLPQAPVVHADETSWKQAGQRRVLWVVVTPLATVFTIAPSRGSQVLKDLIGEAFGGYLVSDRWSAYTWVKATQRQVCWSHLARNFQGLVDRGAAAAQIGKPAVAWTKELFAAWHGFRDDHQDREALAEAMRPVQAQFRALLVEGTRTADDKTQGLCWSLRDIWPALWTFVTQEGVEPTNNAAERALRPAVLWRKGSFGTQSDAGARFVERLLTVAMTCRQQGRSLLEYLTSVCTAAQGGRTIPSLLLATASPQGP